jgi:hypothetical protein
MEMTDQERRDLRSYCAFLHKEYGFHFSTDNPAIPMLYVIHKELQRGIESNKNLICQVEDAASRIDPTVNNFYSGDAAFKFQLGMAIKWLIGGIIILLFVVAGVWHWSNVNDVDRAKAIIQSSKNMAELISQVRKDDNGRFFIDFKAAKGDSINYLTEFKRLDAKTIRVYLGIEAK